MMAGATAVINNGNSEEGDSENGGAVALVGLAFLMPDPPKAVPSATVPAAIAENPRPPLSTSCKPPRRCHLVLLLQTQQA